MTKEQPKLFRRGKRSHLEFVADSADQISHSIEMTGLRDKIDQAFQAAIIRARGNRKESS